MTFVKFIISACLASMPGVTTLPAHADVVVVVSRDSTISSIDRQQLSYIFLGRPYRLPNGAGGMTAPDLLS
ncbi:MAG: hypothetical protein HUJ31_02765, partial [Pseudomonadales bacterium]|nr:hypothetical protein [Pseudomonadales bacterium]